MKRTSFLLPFAAFLSLLIGCAPSVDLEEQNALLHAQIDSLRVRSLACAQQNARLAEENDSLRTAADAAKGSSALPNPASVSASQSVGTAMLKLVPAENIPAAPPPADQAFQSRYQAALTSFNGRNYAQSLALFRDLAVGAPANDLTDNCAYWMGECHYAMAEFDQALSRFGEVLGYPASDKQDDALMMRGNCFIRLNRPGEARAEFRQLLERFPESEYAARAREKLKVLPGE